MKKLVSLIFITVCSVPLLANGASTDMNHLMTQLVIQLAVIVLAARIIGHIFEKHLKQPRVLGELAAGILIGPYALGAIYIPPLHDSLFPLLETSLPVSPQLYGFAVVASIILLFLAGLETDLPTFLKFSVKGSIIGISGVLVSFLFGNLVAVLFLPSVRHFMDPQALFLGTLATATSVGVTARILSEKRKMSTPEGVTILAAAVLDDVLGIIILAVVVGIGRASAGSSAVAWRSIGLIAVKAFGFWFLATALGILLAPYLAKGLKKLNNMQQVAGIAFGIALLLAGISEMAELAMIIGAYITGLSLSQTDIAHELEEKLQGVYQFFVPLFFTVMGMMVNFAAMKGVVVFGLLYTLAAFAGKLFGCGIPALFTGFNMKGAFRIGTGMLPRGEVTLIMAGLGLSSGLIGQDLFGVAIMTLLGASIVAPPLLSASFSKGDGYKKQLQTDTGKRMHSIDLEFPSTRMTSFIVHEVLQAFRREEFFVSHMHRSKLIYHIRKDDIFITLIQEEIELSIQMEEKHEPLVRLLLLEELLELKDFISGLESMRNTEHMGADLLMGIFSSP